MSNPSSIKEVLQTIKLPGLEIVEGGVIQERPLLIKLSNDNLVLSQNSVSVPINLTDHAVKCDILSVQGDLTASTDVQSSDEVGAHTHNLQVFELMDGTIKTYNSLHYGDKVMLLSYNNGKKYYVLDKVV